MSGIAAVLPGRSIRRRSGSAPPSGRHVAASSVQPVSRTAEQRPGREILSIRRVCMLYWAEGSKGRHAIEFSNSDPHMLRVFRRFLTEALAIERDEILLSINAYTNNGLSIEEIERYWLEDLDLPRTAARKHTLNQMPTSSSGRARNRLRFGVCTLRVHSTWMLQHIYGAIQEYAGFEEPRWLN